MLVVDRVQHGAKNRRGEHVEDRLTRPIGADRDAEADQDRAVQRQHPRRLEHGLVESDVAHQLAVGRKVRVAAVDVAARLALVDRRQLVDDAFQRIIEPRVFDPFLAALGHLVVDEHLIDDRAHVRAATIAIQLVAEHVVLFALAVSGRVAVRLQVRAEVLRLEAIGTRTRWQEREGIEDGDAHQNTAPMSESAVLPSTPSRAMRMRSA
mgnify:CR=1 FL=1